MIKPVKSYSLSFVSDGTSTAAEFDLSLLPIAEDFKGALPNQVLSVSVSNLAPITATAALSGTTLTLTFSAAPPELDNTNATIVYVATFLLAFGA